MSVQTKEDIKSSIQSFSQGSLTENALNIFKALGYNTERQAPLDRPDYAAFKDSFMDGQARFNEDKALVKEWKYVDLLFQLSTEELNFTPSLFKKEVTTKLASGKEERTIIETYLFFAIELSRPQYSRTELSQITREVNRLFPMPVMLLFKHGEMLTLSVINRRLHTRDEGRDVLEKVTLIKDIRIDNPHRAHIEILFDLTSDELLRKHRFTNFVELHNAWQKTLDTKELNKRFFQELANWFFWAVQNVEFPDDAEKKRDVRNATNVIRLITRLMFVWFLKEKGLVSEELFDEKRLKKVLVGASPCGCPPLGENTEKGDHKGAPLPNHSIYYKAILQNLFFATLNTEMGKRRFRSKNDSGRDSHYFIHNVFRYEKEFVDPKETLERYFASIPFLNGGLFECLDKEVEEGGKLKRIRIDGFSDRDDNSLKVPDELFFGAEKETDLNDTYGTKNKHYKVRGLIDILSSYKFTIAENTPIEEEVALDPELLGKVFENLLANFNPETQTTARKQTGSFYTPREIVNYMVDESLKGYLEERLAEKKPPHPSGTPPESMANKTLPPLTVHRIGGDKTLPPLTPPKTGGEHGEEKAPLLDKEGLGVVEKLAALLSYSEEPHRFTEEEVIKLISAIDHCKILDPAGGSGAFPMGMLHKLVHILSKLDPDNARWEQRQLDKVDKLIKDAETIQDAGVREKIIEDLQRNRQDIEDSFANNELDYGRKLYLIENCIYGVDIQPIAVQIAKLRFFISLIVEQKMNPEKENLGIRPLPNLETKFVAANTLIGINRPAQLMLRNPQIDKVEEELRQVREKHFAARTPATKEKYRKKDAELRQALTQLLEKDGWPVAEACKIASWDPYNQNSSSPWFDPEWMFGIKDGFDITIGNPPYFNISTVSKELVNTLSAQHKAIHTGYNDIVYYFIYLGIELLKKTGCCALITSNYYLGNEYAKKLRLYLKDHAYKIINFKDHMVFDAASVHTCISISYKEPTSDVITFFEPTDDKQITSSDIEAELKSFAVKRSELKDNWIVADQSNTSIFEKLKQGSVLLGEIATIAKGSESGKNDIFTVSADTVNKFNLEKSILRKCIKNSNIRKYFIDYKELYLLYIDNDFKASVFINSFGYLKNHKSQLLDRRGPLHQEYEWYRLHRPSLKEVFDAEEKLVVPYRAERNCFAYDNNQYFNDGGDIRAIVISNSNFNIKYVLAILNSRLIDWFYGFIGKPKGKVREYFNKPLSLIPIKKISSADQQPFIILVDQILAAKTTPPSAPLLNKEGNKGVIDTSALEKQIDEMVYKLYDLTPEEIAVVEGRDETNN